MATEVEKSLSDNLKFAKYFVKDADDSPNAIQNLLALVEGNILIWTEIKNTVLSVPLNDVIRLGPNEPYSAQLLRHVYQRQSKENVTEKYAAGPRVQRLTLSQAPLFKINFSTLSCSGQYLAMYGDHGVVVVEVPRQWGKDGLFEGGKETIMCRSMIIAEQFFVHHYTVKCLQVLWYPGSPTDSHVVVLTSDNCLRVFDVNQPDEALYTIHLFEDQNVSGKGSFSSFATVFGEMAISIDFGPPLVDATIFPMFVMQESGDTWVLYMKLLQNRFQVKQRGPLTMYPPSDDNYGSEFTSIICLPTSPPVLSISTSKGNAHHCVVLETGNEEESTGELEDTASVSNYSTIDPHLPEIALFVYETVQLDLTLLKTDNELEEIKETGEELPVREKLKLFKDRIRPCLYYCLSSGGIHTIQLPWIESLENFCMPDLDGTTSHVPEISSQADVTFVLCTKPTENCSSSPLLGFTVASDSPTDSCLICLLNNGEFITRPLSAPRTTELSDWEENEEDESRQGKQIPGTDDHQMITTSFNQFMKQILMLNLLKIISSRLHPSPLRKLHAVGSFDDHIQRILKRNSTAPVMRSATGEKEVTPEECYQLLTNAIKILREEYIQKLDEAKMELEKRCKLLQSQKEEQLEHLEHLFNDRELNDNAENLAEKLATASDNMQILTDRLGNVLHIVQSSSPILSEADSEWATEVKDIQQKVLHMKRYSEGIKRKYENLFVLGNVRRSQKRGQSSQLSSSQSIQIRALLKQQSNTIAELVDRLKTMNTQVGS